MAEKVAVVQEKVDERGLYAFEGPVDTVIEMLQELKAAHQGKKLSLDLREDEYGDGEVFAVICERPENEAEAKKRQEQEAQSKAYRRAEYERLKKEFGG